MIVKAISGAALVTTAVCALAPAALAERAHARDLGRFVPALGFVVGIAENGFVGTVDTTDVLGPQIAGPSSEPRLIADTPAKANTSMIIPDFGASLELMTPGWQRIPGSPRGFGRVDVTFAFGPDYNTPLLGNPGEFSVSGSPNAVTEGRVLGQGAKTTVSTAPFLVTAGGGIAFTLDYDGRALRLKPSVEYMRHDVEVSGLVRRAVQVTSPSAGLAGFREVTLSASKKRTYHMVGPGFEVDIDAVRSGGFVFSPYVALKAWRLLDPETTVISDSNQYDEAATWTYTPDNWAFGGTVGVRVRWSPE